MSADLSPSWDQIASYLLQPALATARVPSMLPISPLKPIIVLLPPFWLPPSITGRYVHANTQAILNQEGSYSEDRRLLTEWESRKIQIH